MIKTFDALKYEYRNYNNIYEKIKREVKKGNLFCVQRGIYETNPYANSFAIGNIISTPSYISFETALSYYNLIPERVYLTMSATFRKNKTKMFKNSFGRFYYHDVNEKAFPYGVDIIELEGYQIRIASKEKALLDTLSKKRFCESVEDLEELLFEGMRIEKDDFDNLDKDELIKLSKLYKGISFANLRKMLGDNDD